MPLQLLLLLPLLWEVPTAQDQSYHLELLESVTVQEGLCVLVPCKFSYPKTTLGSLHMFWFRKGEDRNHDLLVATNKPKQKLQENTQGRFFLLGDPQAHNCSLSIRDVNMGDSGTYFFRMERYFRKHSYLDKTLSLHVTALTHRPNILISGSLESSHPRNLTCSVPWACEQGTPPIFSWTSAAITSLGPRTCLSSVLTLTPEPQDHGTNLTCQVNFPAAGVTVERTIQLNVTYAPQNMAISIFQGNSTALKVLQNASTLPVLEGQAVRLLCVADSNPPAELSWFQGSPALNATSISTTAILDLPRLGTTGGDFTCLAWHLLGSQNVSVSLSVVCKPEPRAGRVLGAVEGAGIMGLLSLCLCLIFRVKTCRKKAAQPVQSMDDVNPDESSGSRAHQHQVWTDSPSDHPAPAGASPIAREEQELHYASIRFHKPQEQKDTNTEYTEIKTHKCGIIFSQF
ncbi:sialic acid-binding Ig-like lectin 6 isoform X1 [Diceros bicornis minor]|uniref:sialic acid-binding Ig-like lectin 6 isoform X1 n=1 Tax=Diceros bicornis minor TaxID=77932 RepID=UPI0026F1CDAF|nr:sialic acid-binding Ig-like lectin 6 isoform X1 [Diceros bicornis minor]